MNFRVVMDEGLGPANTYFADRVGAEPGGNRNYGIAAISCTTAALDVAAGIRLTTNN